MQDLIDDLEQNIGSELMNQVEALELDPYTAAEKMFALVQENRSE